MPDEFPRIAMCGVRRKTGVEIMTTLKTLAMAVAFVGSTSLAFAQGPGIAPDSSVLPPQTNKPGGVAHPCQSKLERPGELKSEPPGEKKPPSLQHVDVQEETPHDVIEIRQH